MPQPAKPRWHEGNQQWYAKIGPPGGKKNLPTVVYFPSHIKTEADAWDHFRQYKAKAAKPTQKTAQIEVAELIEMYQDWAEKEAKAGRMTIHTWKNKKSRLKHFARFVPANRRDPLAYSKASDIDVSHMNGLVRSMSETNAANYVQDVTRTVVAMYNWATQPIEGREPTRLLPENPIRDWRSKVTVSPVDRYADASVIRAFRRWAWANARWGWISKEGADRLKAKGRIKPTPAICRKSDRRFDRIFLLMVRFIAFTGCRPKEACTARWADIRWSDDSKTSGTITLDKWKNKKKTGKQRTIFITHPVARILRAIEGLEGRHEEWIFTHRIGPKSPNYEIAGPHRIAGEPWPDGTALAAKMRKFRSWAIEDGVKSKEGVSITEQGDNRLVNYLFRHTYISDTLMAGHTPTEVAALTGTSPEMVDRRYGHIQKDHLAEIAQKMTRKGRGG